MATYYIKKYGVHELHKSNCVWLPIRKGMVEMGNFNTDEEALQKARSLYNNVNSCRTCCNVDKEESTSTVKS